MNNTSNSLNNQNPNKQSEIPQVIYSFDRKDYTINELLEIFSPDFLDLIFLHNVIPPVSPCAAIRVSVPTLNLLIIVLPTAKDYHIYYCDNCSYLSPSLSSQLRPLVNNQTLTQALPPSQNHLAALIAKQQNNQLPKSHHLNSLIRKPKHKKQKNTHTQSLLLPNLQIDLVLLDTLPPFTPQSVIPYLPTITKAKAKRTYIRRNYSLHNNNNNNNNIPPN